MPLLSTLRHSCAHGIQHPSATASYRQSQRICRQLCRAAADRQAQCTSHYITSSASWQAGARSSQAACTRPTVVQQLHSRKQLALRRADTASEWASRGSWNEYGSAANPELHAIPIDAFTGASHQSGPSCIVPLDLSNFLEVDYPATSPNLLSNFVRVTSGKRLETHANATSQTFYVIRGSGETRTEWGTVQWKKGDVMVIPATKHPAVHHADEDCESGAASFYWGVQVNDSPLLAYLGATATDAKFKPTLFREEEMTAEVMKLKADPETAKRNRCGILLATDATAKTTKTLSHVLWALYNLLPANSSQPPHKHSAIALDLAITAPEGKCYTMMAPDLDDQGELIDPVKVPWTEGGVFTTPPGWWHTHHNESDQDAWVYPVQDAGLYTYQRTLNIRFGSPEADNIQAHKQVGATFKGEDIESGYRLHH